MRVIHVFFCEQKTAYEMRISDWSSDVCSSDLPPMKTQLFAAAAAAALTVSMTSAAFASCESGEIVVKFAHVVAAKGSPKGETATALSARVNDEMNGKLCMEVYPNSQLYDDDKIGRAWCRERVCQYV